LATFSFYVAVIATAQPEVTAPQKKELAGLRGIINYKQKYYLCATNLFYEPVSNNSYGYRNINIEIRLE
jgi:hypothetical protein